MKHRPKPIFIACVLTCIAGLMFTAKGFAGGNGSGNEPPAKEKKESAASFCDYVPFACVIFSTQTNGSGNEPPSGT